MFKIPSVGKADGDETKAKKETACKEWLRVVLRTREFTPELKKRIEANNLFLCELHFKAELIVDRKYRVITVIFIGHDMPLFYTLNIYKAAYKLNICIKGQSIKTLLCFFIDGKCKTLDTGAVPTENLPIRSHETKPSSKRRVLVRQESVPSSHSPPVEKKETLDEFARHLREISLDLWTIAAFNETEIRIVLHDSEHSVAKYVLIIDSCLQFSLHVFNWLLPDQHKIYSGCRRRINSGGIWELLQCLSNNKYKICEGL